MISIAHWNKDEWSGLADLLANLIEKYATVLDLDNLPEPLYGDNVFEKCGINRDGAGEVGKPRYFNGKRHF